MNTLRTIASTTLRVIGRCLDRLGLAIFDFGSSIAPTHQQDDVDSIFEDMLAGEAEEATANEAKAMPVTLTLTKGELATVLNALYAVVRVLNGRKFHGSDVARRTVCDVLKRGMDRL